MPLYFAPNVEKKIYKFLRNSKESTFTNNLTGIATFRNGLLCCIIKMVTTPLYTYARVPFRMS